MVALLVGGVAAHAYEEERAFDMLSRDYAQCAAYFAMMTALDETRTSHYRLLADTTGGFAATLSSVELATQRSERAFARIREMIGEGGAQTDAVFAQYHVPCMDLVNDAQARLQYWLDKTD